MRPAGRGFHSLGLTRAVPERGSAESQGTRRSASNSRRGGMAEWSMAVVLKTTVPARVPGVRIPLPPPAKIRSRCRPASQAVNHFPRERGRSVMRVAALYDIHANLPALEAVLQDIRQADVNQVVVG